MYTPSYISCRRKKVGKKRNENEGEKKREGRKCCAT